MTLVTRNAIPTIYDGCHFRSRLEARWAVFFNTLGIRWEYEPQGYYVGGMYAGQDGLEDSEWYLPDFYLPDLGTWVEVKGEFGDLELDTCIKSVDGWSPAGSLPNITDDINGSSGLLVLGDIPTSPDTIGYNIYGGIKGRSGSHVIFTQHKGVQAKLARFVVKNGKAEIEVGHNAWDLGCFDITIWDGPGSFANDARHYTDGKTQIDYLYKAATRGLPREWDKIWQGISGLDTPIKTSDEYAYWTACFNAKSARFDSRK